MGKLGRVSAATPTAVLDLQGICLSSVPQDHRGPAETTGLGVIFSAETQL